MIFLIAVVLGEGLELSDFGFDARDEFFMGFQFEVAHLAARQHGAVGVGLRGKSTGFGED